MSLVFLPGCGTLANLWDYFFGEEREYMVHLHFFTLKPNDQKQTFQAVEYLPGRLLYLDGPAVLDSRDFLSIKEVPHANGKSLEIQLTPHGKMVWTQVTATNYGKQIVVMVDDQYRGWIRITKLDESGTLFLKGPFPPEEARKIIEKLPEHQKKRRR